MAPTMVDCNNNNDENGSTSVTDSEPTAGSSRDGTAKEPLRNETDEFDVSDCFTNDFDDVNGIGMVGSTKNGSFVNIEASQEPVDLSQAGVGGLRKKEEPAGDDRSRERKGEEVVLSVREIKDEKPSIKMLDAATIVLDTSDDEDSQDSLNTRACRAHARASFVKKEEENEDPDIVRLKKDLYQNTAEIDYDLDLEEDEKPAVKSETEPKVAPKTEEQPMVVIKTEPSSSPVKPNLDRLKINSKPIPTIDLTSSDEEIELSKKEEPEVKTKSLSIQPGNAKNSASNSSVCSEYVVVKAEEDKIKIRKKKRKSKKRSKQRGSSSECEFIEDPSPVDRKDDVGKKHSKSSTASFGEAKPALDQKDVEPKDEPTIEEQKTKRRKSDEPDYVLATITKELETPVDSSEQKTEEEETGPFVNTDIALEDLLNDFLEDETVPQNPSQVLFPTVSNEEDKLLLNSPFVESERIFLAELDNIFEDDKLPLPDKIEELPEELPLFTYTICDPSLNIAPHAVIAQPQSEPEQSTSTPKARFRIVQGRVKYPPPPPPEKKRPGRPAKVIERPPPPPPRPSRTKRYESDEEYIPSFARARRIQLRPRRARRRAPQARLVAPVPNGYYSTELQLQPESDEPEEPTTPTPPEEQEQQHPACQSPLAASDGLYMNMPSLEEGQAARSADGAPKRPGRKRGRAPKQHIEDYFCPSPGSKKDSTETPAIDGRKPQPQLKRRKKRSRISSYSTNSEDETTESISLAATVSTITANRSVIATHEEEADNNKPLPVEPKPPKTDNLSIVVSPLTKEEIAKRSKCITPKKVRALSKASQTELKGLSWRIELNQIDFHSEYFERLYQLIKNGRELRKLSHPSNNNNFEGVVIVGRDAVRPPTPPERSPQRPPAAAPNGRARSIVEQLLFERTDEVEYVTTARVEPSERERMERSIRTNFRIPKIAKQSSRSPQDVTSSTHHDNDQQLYREDESRQSSSGDYSNDRQVTPEPQRQIAVGSRSPLRVENVLNSNAVTINRPVVAAPAAAAELARPLPAIRRTIRNENVQPPVVASQQPQPVESRYPAYRAQPEQAPPQYQANVFQPQPQIPPQQQQLGAYMASGQEMDVKPNISAALTPQAAMLGPGMMNRSSIFDSFQFMCQLTMMQMMQQQLQFPTMNAGGQMFPGPSVVPTAAACNPTPAPVPPMPPVQMMPPPAGVQQDEVSDQITQIFGCIDHLKGRCIKNPCQYPHTLPTEATLRQMLQASAQDVVMTTYHFIVGQDNLFMRYFPVYSEVMGRRNMRHQLIDAVSHCEQSKRAFPYYRYIVEGLTISGTLNRSKAVQLVLEKHRKISFDQIHVLISLILDTGDDVPQFLPWLDQFSQVQDYQYEIPSINRLLKCCVRSARSTNAPLHGTVADVAKLTFRLVMSVATGKEPFVDTDTLIEYAELLMRSNLGLDHEKLMHKYGKNELASSATRH